MSMLDSKLEMMETRLTMSLALMRVSLGAFLLVWAVMKFTVPKGTIGIFEKFYGLSIDVGVSMALGAMQAVLAVLIILGLWRTWTYGFGVVMHGVSQLSSWRETLDPWALFLNDKPKMLFWAGVPVLAAFIALWLLRDWDRWSLDGRRGAS